MSLLIEGMDMPKCCCDCFLYDSAGFCALDPTREFDDYNHKSPDDCTLVEIPTPHGRLIDADALSKALKKRWNVDDDQDFANKSVWRELENAPTIIEAEK